jgi:hypothetical protein
MAGESPPFRPISAPLYIVIPYLLLWIVVGYAFLYGFPLFIAGSLVGAYCGWLIHVKLWPLITKLWTSIQ